MPVVQRKGGKKRAEQLVDFLKNSPIAEKSDEEVQAGLDLWLSGRRHDASLKGADDVIDEGTGGVVVVEDPSGWGEASAVAGFLAAYRGSTRVSYTTDLRWPGGCPVPPSLLACPAGS